MKRQRITPVTEMLMYGTAWAAYSANFLVQLIAGWIGIGLIASTVFMVLVYSIFIFWFICIGVNIFDPKLIGNFGFGAIVSSIPVLNIFYISLDKKTGIPSPGIRKNVSRVIEIIKQEDFAYNQKQQMKSGRRQAGIQSQRERLAKIQLMRESQADQKDLYEEAS